MLDDTRSNPARAIIACLEPRRPREGLLGRQYTANCASMSASNKRLPRIMYQTYEQTKDSLYDAGTTQ